MRKNRTEVAIFYGFIFSGIMLFILGIYMCVDQSFQLPFLVIFAFAIIFLLVGLNPYFSKLKRRRLLEKLKNFGDLINAEYVETTLNESYSVNHRHPYVIVCKWINPYDGEEYIFESENFWVDPANIIEENSIKSFPVYITKEKIDPYVMDTEILNNYIHNI